MSHELLKQKLCSLVCDLLLEKTFPHNSSSGIHKKDRKLWITSGFLSIPNDIEVTPQLGPNYSLQYLWAFFKEHSLCLLKFYSNIE